MAGLLLLASAGSPCATQVPQGVILVKGAWSSASDSATPLPEGGTTTGGRYDSPYFRLTYPLTAGWSQQYEGPPPSDSGYYVLAQLQPPASEKGPRGSVLIAAQDMFFSLAPAKSALELVRYAGNHLRGDSVVERPPAEAQLASHSFARLDYFSPAAGLHWTVLATQIRCHTVQFTFTRADGANLGQLLAGMAGLRLPADAGVASGTGGEGVPVCIRDYANSGYLLSRVDPLLTDRRYNPIPVRVIIDVRGRVKHIHFISSFPEQARVITAALQEWRFKPYVVNGNAVEVETGLLFGAAASRASDLGQRGSAMGSGAQVRADLTGRR